MRVEVDWDLCESNGMCVAAAPEVFRLTDDDMLDVMQETPDESLRDKVQQAEWACPKAAIRIVD